MHEGKQNAEIAYFFRLQFNLSKSYEKDKATGNFFDKLHPAKIAKKVTLKENCWLLNRDTQTFC